MRSEERDRRHDAARGTAGRDDGDRNAAAREAARDVRAAAPGATAKAGPVPFAYAVLRVVPDQERGERLNAGVVLFSRQARFLAVHAALDEARLRALAPGCDASGVRAHLDGLARVAAGDPAAGAIAAADPSDRFGWLVAPSSTVVQASEVHTGITEDAPATLRRLAARLVG